MVKVLFPSSDLFGWVPEVIQWLGDTFGWVAEVVRWLGEEFSWVAEVVIWLGGAIAWLASWLGSRIAWTWQVNFPISHTARAVAVIALLGIAAGSMVRRLRLHWLARSPRVQIGAFTWTGPGETDREAIWVTSLFREQLGALRLEAQDPLPERAPGDPLVDIVEGVTQGVGQKADLGRAFGRLFRALWPRAAYEAWGTLQPQRGKGGRISVQLVDGRGRVLISVAPKEASWEDGARQAAMATAGALYPRVGIRHRGPWTLWTEAVPRKLVTAYFQATEHEQENRLEEALGDYHEALELDPLNPHLRLRIAMLQERLALYLDAWVTYGAIVDEQHRAAWKGADRKARLLALYRQAILLGNRQVAKQWVRHDATTGPVPTKRDEERHRLREELRMALERDPLFTAERSAANQVPDWGEIAKAPSERLLEALCNADRTRHLEKRAALIKLFRTEGPEMVDMAPEKRVEWIGDALQIVSLRRLEELDTWLRLGPVRSPVCKGWWLRRPSPSTVLRRQELSRAAVRVSKRLARIRIAANAERGVGNVYEIRREHVKLTSSWPFPSRGIHRQLARFFRPRQRLANGRTDAWQLHYNASCAAATVLLKGSVLRNAGADAALPAETDEDSVVCRAIEELEKFARRAGSRQVAALADWVAIDDPDLEGLSQRPEFKLWASHHLPRGLPKERAHRGVDVNRHTARILHRGARAFARSWRRRAETNTASVDEIARWWRQERDAWRTLWEVCLERRSWKLRLDGLTALRVWQETNTPEPEPIDFAHEPRGETITSPKLSADLLEDIATLVGGERLRSEPLGRTILGWVDSHAAAICEAHQSSVSRGDSVLLQPQRVRGEALRLARIWHGLADALNAELNGENAPAFLAIRLEAIRMELPSTR
jgi:tetratricopeptide (TPR) repeat protein